MQIKYIAALLIAGITGTAHASSIVTNGDFETSFSGGGLQNGGQTFDQLNVSGASWNIWTSIPGWTTTSGAGIEIQSNRTLGSIDAHSGSHYVELDSNNNTSMTQQVSLAIGLHELSFFYSPRRDAVGSNGIEFSIAGLLSPETVTGPDAGLGYAVGAWTEVTRTFSVATAGLYALNFAAAGTSDSHGGLIDSVSISKMPSQVTAPVPLPAGIVLLGTGAAALSALRLRRKA